MAFPMTVMVPDNVLDERGFEFEPLKKKKKKISWPARMKIWN